MLKTKVEELNLIDNSLFLFKCNLDIKKGSQLVFSYRTDKKRVHKIFIEFFDLLNRINKSKNFVEEFQQKRNSHRVENEEKKKKEVISTISKIYKKANFKDDWIEQKIIDGAISQTKLGDQGARIFFLKESTTEFIILKNGEKRNVCIIKPLFLDVNHLIYKDTKRTHDISTNICLVCGNFNCS